MHQRIRRGYIILYWSNHNVFGKLSWTFLFYMTIVSATISGMDYLLHIVQVQIGVLEHGSNSKMSALLLWVIGFNRSCVFEKEVQLEAKSIAHKDDPVIFWFSFLSSWSYEWLRNAFNCVVLALMKWNFPLTREGLNSFFLYEELLY